MYLNPIPNARQWTPPAPQRAGAAAGLGDVVRRVSVPKVIVMRRRGFGALWSPSPTTTETSMVNWAYGTVNVPSNEQFAGQIVQALENDLSYKIQSGGFIMDPAACVDKVVNELRARCSTYPDLCVNQDLAAVAAPMCGHYADYLDQKQAQYGTEGNVGVAPTAFATWSPDAGAYVPATQATVNNLQYAQTGPRTAGGTVTVLGAAPAPAPAAAPLPPVQYESGVDAQRRTQQATQPGATQPGAQPGGGAAPAAGGAMSEFLSQTFNVGGLSIPAWAGIAAAGVAFFMFSGGRR